MAAFITFEGGDGTGKSTQAKALIEHLKAEKKRAFYAEEPGTTLLGKMLRIWMSHPGRPLTLMPEDGTQLSFLEHGIDDQLMPNILLHTWAPRAELLAFTIARAQLVDEFITPHLVNHNIIVCNRFADSTVAYQGYGRGLDLNLVNMVNEIATKGLKPNLTILLDLSPEEGLARKWETNKDHFEKQVLDFHHKVREGYLKLAAEEPARWMVVDASKSKVEVSEIIWQRVRQLLPGR